MISSERSFALLGGSYVDGEPPVYEDETTVDTETETEIDTDADTTDVESETAATTETTTQVESVTSDGSDETPAGCKAVLPTVGLLIPTVALLLPVCKRTRRRK